MNHLLKIGIVIWISFVLNSLSLAQVDNFRFQKYLKKYPERMTAFAIAYEGESTLKALKSEQISVKQISKNWIFVQATARQIARMSKQDKIKQFYFEFHNAQPLSDTARVVEHVKEVHDGYGDLLRGYTGKNVLIGFVDAGLDWTHPDFIDANGVHRVIAYWDQSAPTDATAPQPYNYGKSCDSMSIVNGTCPLTEPVGSFHGTTVTGAATGNGRADGKEIGMATEAKIVAIQTNFNAANWTLTVADACDYLFRIADSLGLPAVMNLSVGSYYGSHDGMDPASELMEQLVEAKSGRIIVSAMGNSGDKGDYHLKGKIFNDTNFVWFMNNPTNQIQANSIYFDWWSDTATSNQLQIGFAGNDSLTFVQTPYTNFVSLKNMASHVIDTLRTNNGNKLAIVEMYKTLVGSTYEFEALIRDIDSLNYFYQLAVSGIGEFDLWSGKWSGLNDMVTRLPSAANFPRIVNYLRPDSLSTLVSSWACSDKIVTVGNIRNRVTHIDGNGNVHPYNPLPPVGFISFSSSRGPTRHNVFKPDVASNGDMMMGAAPAFMRQNSAYNPALEFGGWHARNGGTSMASPVVAGIAALYLEKCNSSDYKDYIRDISNNTDVFPHYGIMPNYTYGNGRINAYKALVHNGTFNYNGGYCGADFNLGVIPLDSMRNFSWSTGETTPEITITQPGTYTVTFEYGKNCYSTLTKMISLGTPPIQPIITSQGNVLTSTFADSYQWYKDGQKLVGENNQNLVIVSGGYYQVKISDTAGCSNYSDVYHSTLSIDETKAFTKIFPNPAYDFINIVSDANIEAYEIYSVSGVLLRKEVFELAPVDIRFLGIGTYILKLKSPFFVKTFKLIKQ